jgi:hypothetical protein
MSDLHIEYTLATHPDFQARVHMAMARVAAEVCAEPTDVPGHALRIQLARTLLSPASLTAVGYAPSVAVHPPVSQAACAAHDPQQPAAAVDALTDELILDAVRALWNPASGYTP